MILPLRRRHQRMFLVLAVVLPLLFAWGIAMRRELPVMPDVGPATAGVTAVNGGRP